MSDYAALRRAKNPTLTNNKGSTPLLPGTQPNGMTRIQMTDWMAGNASPRTWVRTSAL